MDITRRDLFAAFAMLGHFVINQDYPEHICSPEFSEKLAEASYVMADKMEKASSVQTGQTED